MAEPRQRYKDSEDMSKAAPTDLPVEKLGAWLEQAVGDFRGLHTARKFAGGQSNPTFLLEADSGRYVLRRKPPGTLLPSAHAVDREFKVISALHPQGFEIVGISFDQDEKKLKDFVKKQEMPWVQYFDGQGWQNKFGQEFGIQSIPTMWLIDRKGNLRNANARGGLEAVSYTHLPLPTIDSV